MMSFSKRIGTSRSSYRNRISRHAEMIGGGEMIEVKESNIHRFGCFAKRRIRKGTVVGEYIGKIIPERESYIYDADDEMTYLFDLENGDIIDATNQEFPLKYANHSCSPNCESYQDGDRVFVEALQDIEPGEEITYDYHLISDDKVICLCGSKGCRGMMNRSLKVKKK